MGNLIWMVVFIGLAALNWHSAYVYGAFRSPTWSFLFGLGLCVGYAIQCGVRLLED